MAATISIHCCLHLTLAITGLMLIHGFAKEKTAMIKNKEKLIKHKHAFKTISGCDYHNFFLNSFGRMI